MSILEVSQLLPELLGSHSCQAKVRHSVNIFSSQCYARTHAQTNKKDSTASPDN